VQKGLTTRAKWPAANVVHDSPEPSVQFQGVRDSERATLLEAVVRRDTLALQVVLCQDVQLGLQGWWRNDRCEQHPVGEIRKVPERGHREANVVLVQFATTIEEVQVYPKEE